MKRPVVNEWITINGESLLCQRFIQMLDRVKWRMPWVPERAEQYYSHASGIIQQCTDEYMHGAESIQGSEDFFEHHCVHMPDNKQYPDAIEAIYRQLEENLNEKIRSVMNDCLIEYAEKSREDVEENKKEQERQQRLYNSVSELLPGLPVDPIDRVAVILKLQMRKKADDSYQVSDEEMEKEDAAAELWCDILMHSVFSEYLTYCHMKSMVQQRIVEESDISTILEELGDERDFEWYDEDFAGMDLMDETIIPNETILKVIEPVICAVLHISLVG